MKNFFNLVGPVVVGLMMLAPYVFLGKQWDFFATFLCIASVVLVAIMIVGVVKKMENLN